MKHRRLIHILRFEGSALLVSAAATIFIYTGVAKLIDPAAFSKTIASHGLLPADLAPNIAWGVIALELAIGISALWLVLGERRIKPAAIATAILFGSFAWYAGAMVLFPPPAPASCGCAWASAANDQPANWRVIAGRDSVAAALLLLMIPAASQTRAQRSPR